MDTVRVDICYRPLRIAWVIHSGDRDAFRQAVRLTHTMWGGRFNPIVLVDQPDDAKQIIELFRVDMIVPIGSSADVVEFPKRFPHLINPLFPDTLFFKDTKRPASARLLDMHNALLHWRDTPEWKAIDAQGVRRFVWDDDDPLGDAFLLQYGAYPDANDIGIDYGDILSQATLAVDCRIDKAAPVPLDVLNHPSIGYLCRHGLRRHYTVRAGWNYAGFFVGDAGNIDDLICFWNLRAADVSLQFIDPAHMARYAITRPEYERRTLAGQAHLDEHHRNLAIWSRAENIDDTLKLFGGQGLTACRASGPFFWNGGAVRPPMMIFGEASSLGVFGQEQGKPKVSFALNSKPFVTDSWFHTQHLVASVTLSGDDDQFTFDPPYVPEWNEFFARQMHFHYDKLRIEPERIGIIIDAADHDTFLYGLAVDALVKKLFESGGLTAKLSGGGLIVRQLIARLGGLGGARPFKIPGVRRLLKTFGPRDAFTMKAALQLIGKRDPKNPQANFADHKHLYIEPRPYSTELTPQMVFEYLVEKALFRIGAELTCPSCNLASWIALDALKQENVCELCGNTFDATRQLMHGVLHYRRTGVLGLERNSQGAVPVTLVLQQLDVNLSSIGHKGVYAPSYDLLPNAGVDVPPCEVDFVIIRPRTYPDKAEVVLAECKDVGGAIDATDVDNLRRVAEVLPQHRFETYILFAKLAPFTPEEIELIRPLNGPYQNRVILLTSRELEPYHIFERTKAELGIDAHGGSLEELARVTRQIYFPEPVTSTASAPASTVPNKDGD
jgi:hypothetical protein